MSTYIRLTKHPVTKKYEPAVWIDDYFGQHNYGVQFYGEDVVTDVKEYDFKTRDAKNKKDREMLENLFHKLFNETNI